MPENSNDTPEDKAQQIADKIGASKPEKPGEVVPDYDVKESDASGEAVDDTGEDDKRLAKERDAERDDHRKLSNREKRQLKKKRVAEKLDAKDAVIRQLQEQNAMIAARLNDVDGRLSNFDQAQFTQSWNASVEAFNAAERKHQDAFAAGDGKLATEAMREMYAAQKTIDHLEEIRQRQPMTRQPAQQQPRVDAGAMNKAKSWVAENPWFKAGGADDDSVIADAIAAKLKKEGYDPTTDDYWDELDERLEKRGIGSRDNDDDDEDQSQSENLRQEEEPRRRERQEPAKRRGSPPVGGGSGRGDLGAGKQQVTLPTEYVNTLKQNGLWDNVEQRNRLIKGYLERVKEAQR